ncbi:sensor histidine kinase inhibitor, KipI family [Thermodesulfobium acidiphilum]|uniref:Sensor histidine kinase inhibitor, KipI family n=1 Tax=Thermodesulfobium acidiphilum TaxID=1794699 RepID=A0A2R4W2K1_THEAF|nr:5-oxoprolinase subunit PxpB [Thermodesulfobium acidiphilum]AWB10948.1 sensor histidine kinase inhibitor, KipI family [Thermodesulfobium acidiphilum]
MGVDAKFSLVSEGSLLIEIGDKIDYEISKKISALSLAFKKLDIIDITVSYSSLLIDFDPLKHNFNKFLSEVKAIYDFTMLNFSPSDKELNIREIFVKFGGQYGPDLKYVADFHNISEEEVIEEFTSKIYMVFMLGFTPGFAYMGILSDRIATPRLSTPRLVVEAGSVGIAGNQTGIYPSRSPGGWRIIGRTEQVIFSPEREDPFFLKPSDYVRFIRVDC